MAMAGTACRTRHPAPTGWMHPCRERPRLLQKGLCSLGSPVTPGCTNPACYPPPQHPGTRCCAGRAGGISGLLLGYPVRSKSPGPFSNPTSCLQARLALPVGEVRRWPRKQWGQFRISPAPLFDKIPGCRLALSLISHGWISGFMLAGCPGEGWLLPRDEGSHLQR